MAGCENPATDVTPQCRVAVSPRATLRPEASQASRKSGRAAGAGEATLTAIVKLRVACPRASSGTSNVAGAAPGAASNETVTVGAAEGESVAFTWEGLTEQVIVGTGGQATVTVSMDPPVKLTAQTAFARFPGCTLTDCGLHVREKSGAPDPGLLGLAGGFDEPPGLPVPGGAAAEVPGGALPAPVPVAWPEV
jgi:hypothetical protein